MAVITGSTFKPLLARCNVRLQQGVPIVDADWNELDDIRKFEMRAYLKWFVGEGIPDGSDTFKIEESSTPVNDDFRIRAGVAAAPVGTSDFDAALRFAGRAIIDGLDVMIASDINYKNQPLFAASAFGVPKIAPIAPAAGSIAVYLDVWERLVTPQEDGSLVLPGIGTESCARMKREWCVRTRTGNTVPPPAEAIAGHSYYLLAVITRPPGAPITNALLQDRRHLKLSLASMEARLSMLEQLLLIPRFSLSPNQFNPKIGFAGNTITLFGDNLDIGAVTVRFGATLATLVGTPTDNQIQVKVPSVATGQTKISIQTGGGTITSDDNFTVVPIPAPIFSASPNQFNPKLGAPGTNVTLFGSNFDIAPVTTRFGTTDAEVIGTASGQLIVKVPDMLPAAVKLTVQTPGGTTTSVDNFTVGALPPAFTPSPNQFSPKTGPAGTTVTIFGTNLNIQPVQVFFGAMPATIVGQPQPTQIVVTAPNKIINVVKIQVRTAGGLVNSADDYTYP